MAGDVGWNTRPAQVTLLDVLYAIRYGMGRLTYANGDAAQLARRFWDEFPPFIQDQIMDDVLMYRKNPDIWHLDELPWFWLFEKAEQREKDG